MMVLLVALALLAVIASYVLYVRPRLEDAGIVCDLPDLYSGWRDRVHAFLRGSLTIAWGWLVTLASSAMAFVYFAGELTGDETLKQQVLGVVPPEHLPKVGLCIGVITILSRMRTARLKDM